MVWEFIIWTTVTPSVHLKTQLQQKYFCPLKNSDLEVKFTAVINFSGNKDVNVNFSLPVFTDFFTFLHQVQTGGPLHSCYSLTQSQQK